MSTKFFRVLVYFDFLDIKPHSHFWVANLQLTSDVHSPRRINHTRKNTRTPEKYRKIHQEKKHTHTHTTQLLAPLRPFFATTLLLRQPLKSAFRAFIAVRGTVDQHHRSAHLSAMTTSKSTTVNDEIKWRLHGGYITNIDEVIQPAGEQFSPNPQPPGMCKFFTNHANFTKARRRWLLHGRTHGGYDMMSMRLTRRGAALPTVTTRLETAPFAAAASETFPLSPLLPSSCSASNLAATSSNMASLGSRTSLESGLRPLAAKETLREFSGVTASLTSPRMAPSGRSILSKAA